MPDQADGRQRIGGRHSRRVKVGQAAAGNKVTQTKQTIEGDANQVAGRDIVNTITINIEQLHITLGHGSTTMPTKIFDPDLPYRLSEDQHTKLYHASHLLTVLDCLAMVGTASDRDVTIPRESMAVVFGMASDLVKEAMPRAKGAEH